MPAIHTNTLTEINKILDKAKNLRGYNLKELINHFDSPIKETVPRNNKNTKGLTGQLVELLLGASAGSKPLPDFPDLGLEIKTLPIDLNGEPKETTYVCTAPLICKNNDATSSFDFKASTVYKKLAHVLWLPIIINKKSASEDKWLNRVIGNPFLWQPNKEQFNLLQTDWLELTQMLLMGDVEKVSSHYGTVLQIRPKAANSKALTTAIGSDGEKINTIPRGFYLRTHFTKEIYLANSSGEDILP
jgi:DNA mismatch repair protein MutH